MDVNTTTRSALIIDGNESDLACLSECVSGMGYDTTSVSTIAAACPILRGKRVDILLLSLDSANIQETASIVKEIRALSSKLPVLVTTAFPSLHSAIEAMRIGAVDYLAKPFALSDLCEALERISQSRCFATQNLVPSESPSTGTCVGTIVGYSPEIDRIRRMLSKIARSNSPVLIRGESGTGKKLVARSVHGCGPNAGNPLVIIKVGVLMSTVGMGDLFACIEDALIGANKLNDELLASANTGTVLLDEIGEISLDLQGNLLRLLQENELGLGKFKRGVPMSFRILAATNRDVPAMVRRGEFRNDLFCRLNVVSLRIPPLRDRREDIPLLAKHFLYKRQCEYDQEWVLSDEALKLMVQYDWPGNVRELENAVESACTLADGPLLRVNDMPPELVDLYYRGSQDAEHAPKVTSSQTSVRSIAEIEKQAILGTLQQLHGDKIMTARLLGIGKSAFYRKLKEYGLDRELFFPD